METVCCSGAELAVPSRRELVILVIRTAPDLKRGCLETGSHCSELGVSIGRWLVKVWAGLEDWRLTLRQLICCSGSALCGIEIPKVERDEDSAFPDVANPCTQLDLASA
jgi:hypothetical protein